MNISSESSFVMTARSSIARIGRYAEYAIQLMGKIIVLGITQEGIGCGCPTVENETGDFTGLALY
jgi:hypothetical protein